MKFQIVILVLVVILKKFETPATYGKYQQNMITHGKFRFSFLTMDERNGRTLPLDRFLDIEERYQSKN